MNALTSIRSHLDLGAILFQIGRNVLRPRNLNTEIRFCKERSFRASLTPRKRSYRSAWEVMARPSGDVWERREHKMEEKCAGRRPDLQHIVQQCADRILQRLSHSQINYFAILD